MADLKKISPLDNSADYKLMVALRIRPLFKEERTSGAKQVVYNVDEQVLLVDPADISGSDERRPGAREKQYKFDKAFGPKTSQKDVYNECTKKLVKSVFDGFNATVFAYGATGAGKTYTMIGTTDEPGIMARALDSVFRTRSQNFNTKYDIKMSYLEIYNETLRDLLKNGSGHLDLREDPQGAVHVTGLSEVRAASSRSLLEHLIQGNRRRTQEPTVKNQTSSRSHAIMQLTISEVSNDAEQKDFLRVTKLVLIDLAGSERTASDQVVHGTRMKEGSHINRSLLALGNVINNLTDKGSKFVNYRDSKLTRLLKDSLGGNSVTVMIANISPASTHFEESRNTLAYAARAKHITNKVVIYSPGVTKPGAEPIVEPVSDDVTKKNVVEGTQEVRVLKDTLFRNETNKAIVPALTPAVNFEHMDEEQRREFLNLKSELIGAFQQQLILRHRLMEINDQAFDVSLAISTKQNMLDTWRHRNPNQFRDPVFEPDRILNLRREVRRLENKFDELLSKRKEIEYDLEQNRAYLMYLERTLPQKAAMPEQNEMVNLLNELQDAQGDKAALESDQLLKDRKLLRQENALRSFQRYSNICDALINEQRVLLGRLPPKISDLFQDYHTKRLEAQHFLQPLNKQATQLGLKSWNRQLLDKERRQSEGSPDLTKTLTYVQLKRIKAERALSGESHSLLPDISGQERLPVITSAKKRPYTVDDLMLTYNKPKARGAFLHAKRQETNSARVSSFERVTF